MRFASGALARLALAVTLVFLGLVQAADKNKPHGHKGVLEPYSGKPLPCKPTGEQSKKLDKGEPVMITETVGKSGRGVVIQDVNSPPSICMDKIRDLPKYPKMVPHVKSIEIYETKKSFTGQVKVGAKYNVGLMGMGFGYFLMHTYEPLYNTLTWTLDYTKNSDFDDNVGHWQVMNHPTKKGWSRVLYSTNVKLFPWIPKIVVNFLTSKALVESTSWVKRESELEAAKQAKKKSGGLPSFTAPKWLGKHKGGATATDGQAAAAAGEERGEDGKLGQRMPLQSMLGFKLRLPMGKAF